MLDLLDDVAKFLTFPGRMSRGFSYKIVFTIDRTRKLLCIFPLYYRRDVMRPQKARKAIPATPTDISANSAKSNQA